MYKTTADRFFSAAGHVAFGLVVGGGIIFLSAIASKQTIEDECEQKLLYQQAEYRAMLKDTHRFYTIKMESAEIAEVLCIDVENMTARELLWHMEEIFSQTDVVIE